MYEGKKWIVPPGHVSRIKVSNLQNLIWITIKLIKNTQVIFLRKAYILQKMKSPFIRHKDKIEITLTYLYNWNKFAISKEPMNSYVNVWM